MSTSETWREALGASAFPVCCPATELFTEDLKRRLLAGRYGEIRMLFFLGKDVYRWMEQRPDRVGHIRN